MSDGTQALRSKVVAQVFEAGETSEFHRLILDVLEDYDDLQEQLDRVWLFVTKAVATEPEATERVLALPEIAALIKVGELRR